MSISRVRYVERQVLHAADLTDEQSYTLALRRRHNETGHQWGIVFGLALEADAAGCRVQPGMAIDGFGRELILSIPLALAWDNWGEDKNQQLFDVIGVKDPEGDARWVDVWMLYGRSPASPPIRGRHECGPDQFTRWVETPVICLLPGDREVDPRAPNIPIGDLAFGPQDDPPDEPERQWPIYLGSLVQRSGGYHYRPGKRPYVRLVGQAVTAASRQAQMQLTDNASRTRFAVTLPDDTGALTDDRLALTSAGDIKVWGQTNVLADAIGAAHRRQGNFTLANQPLLTEHDIADSAGLVDGLVSRSNAVSEALWSDLDQPTQDKLTRLATEGGGVTRELRQQLAAQLSRAMQQHLALTSGLAGRQFGPIARRLATGRQAAVSPPVMNRLLLRSALPGVFTPLPPGDPEVWGAEFQPLASVPAAAAPWQIYQAVVSQAGKESHQLRVELAHPGDKGDPRLYQLQIGHFQARHREEAVEREPNVDTKKEKLEWISCLTVLADGTVIIPKGAYLHVDGEVIEGPIQADPSDPRFGAALLGQATRGVATSHDLTLEISLTDATGAPINDGATTPKGLLHCKFTATNTSGNNVTGGPIYYNLSIGGVVQTQGQAGSLFNLAANSYQTFSVDFTPSVPGPLVIAALVLVVGPQGQSIQAQGDAGVTVGP